MSFTINQLIAEQRALDQRKKDFAVSLRPMLASIGYGISVDDPLRGKTTTNVSAPVKILSFTTKAKRRTLTRHTLKCPKCDRRFGHAMHLGRHTATIHAATTTARAIKRRAKRS